MLESGSPWTSREHRVPPAWSVARLLLLAVTLWALAAPSLLSDTTLPLELQQRLAGAYGYTRDTDPVEIELQNPKASVHLSIPKAYLIYKPAWNGGRFDFVAMEAELPNMTPPALDPREMVPAEDRVHITLKASVPRGGLLFIKHRLETLRQTERDGQFVWYHSREIVDGSGKPHVRPYDNEYAVPVGQESSPQRLFSCLPPAPNRKVGCTVYTEFAVNETASMGLDYQIRRSELPRWPDIDEAVRKLVASFVTADPQH